MKFSQLNPQQRAGMIEIAAEVIRAERMAGGAPERIDRCRQDAHELIRKLGLDYCPAGVPEEACPGAEECDHITPYEGHMRTSIRVHVKCSDCSTGIYETSHADRLASSTEERMIAGLIVYGWIPRPDGGCGLLCSSCAAKLLPCEPGTCSTPECGAADRSSEQQAAFAEAAQELASRLEKPADICPGPPWVEAPPSVASGLGVGACGGGAVVTMAMTNIPPIPAGVDAEATITEPGRASMIPCDACEAPAKAGIAYRHAWRTLGIRVGALEVPAPWLTLCDDCRNAALAKGHVGQVRIVTPKGLEVVDVSAVVQDVMNAVKISPESIENVSPVTDRAGRWAGLR